MGAIKAKQLTKSIGECGGTATAIAVPLSLPASPATAPAQHSKAGVSHPTSLYAVSANIFASLALLHALMSLRQIILNAPLRGDALAKVREIRKRRELLRLIDSVTKLLLRQLLASILKLKRTPLKVQVKVTRFLATVNEITKSGGIRLRAIERWISELKKRLQKIAELQKLWKQVLTEPLSVLWTQPLISRSPPQSTKPVNFSVTDFFAITSQPRATRAPAPRCPLAWCGSG